MNDNIQKSFSEAADALSRFSADPVNLEKTKIFAEKLAETIVNGGKAISCGNGGSMCDAMHFAEELTGRFCEDRRPLPAIAISDPSHITCTGNDYGFDAIFSRYIEAIGNYGDLLLAISTSGNSPNVIHAVMAAREKEMFTVGLLGKDGGKLANMVDLPIIVPASTSDRIQEIHIKVIHVVIETAEKLLLDPR